MGQPAARVGDPAGHGGVLGPLGAKTVKIGGMFAVRVGDSFLCPGFDGPKPHIMGNVGPIGSMTVKIEGGFAAREADPTGCGAAGVSAVGMPAVTGPPATAGSSSSNDDQTPGAFNKKGSVYGDGDAGFLWGQHEGYDNADGTKDGVKGSVEHIEGKTTVGGTTLSGEFDGITGSAEAHSGSNAAGASAEVSGATAKVEAKNAEGTSVGASGKLLHGEANVDIGAGTDGRRTGIWAGAGAQYSAAEGQIDSTNVINIPFTNYSVQIGNTLGGSVGGAGAAAAGGAYHDAKDDRYHLMGIVDGELFIGIKFGLDISFGKRASSSPPPVSGIPGVSIPITPGKIIKGCPTVKIGG